MGRLAAAVMAAAVLVLAGAFVSLADEGGDTTRFVSGTKVNGVGVGGLTVDEAKARIEGFYAGEYNLTIRERGGRQETIAGTDIGYKVEVPEDLRPYWMRRTQPDVSQDRMRITPIPWP